MKPSEILRVAAQRVESKSAIEGGAGCYSIAFAYGKSHQWASEQWQIPEETMRYFRMVRPAKITSFAQLWWGADEDGPRIIGLCLAAAIAESEGK